MPLIASSALTVGLLTGLRGFAFVFAQGVSSVETSSIVQHVQSVTGLLLWIWTLRVAEDFVAVGLQEQFLSVGTCAGRLHSLGFWAAPRICLMVRLSK